MERAIITKIFDNVWQIDDAGESNSFVIAGKDKAMVIDTVNGMENLQEVVRTLTDLPLVVVNTHGHCDHIAGNVFFDEIWIHPAEEALAQEHYGFFREEMEKQNLTPGRFRFLEVGQVFDLGGVRLEVVSLRGHTAGSVGFLDRGNRVLFSGDGVIATPWMQLDESLPISTLLDSLTGLKRDFGADFDHVLTGHAKGLTGADLVDKLIRGCEELLRGETGSDRPYHYFAGEALWHPVEDENNIGIVYKPENLK